MNLRINKELILLILVIVLGLFLRFYHLGVIPSGFLNDEANTGYDSYSILLTARDQWGSFLPITNFKGFGDYPPSMYRYFTSFAMYFFGVNEFSVRFTSAIAGLMSILVLYYLTKKLFNQKIAIISSFLFAIMPWAVGLSRVGIESNLAILFVLLALFFGLKNKQEERIKNLSIAAILLGFSIYTYSAYLLFSPLLLLIIFYENIYKNKFKLKNILLPLLIFILIIFPVFINKISASTRLSQVGLTTNINSIGLLDTLNMQRGSCLTEYHPTICKLINNKPILFSSTFFKNYLSHFSPNFFYINGNPTQYSILESRGLDYIFGIIFLISGLYFLIKVNKNTKISLVIILLFLISPIPDSLTGDGNFSRSSMMQPFISVISGLGLYLILTKLNLIKNLYLRRLMFLSILFIIFFSVFSFYLRYDTYFKNNYSTFSQYGYKELMVKVELEKKNYSEIYISRHLNETKQYIYYLFFNKYDPVKYQTKKDVSYSNTSDGWVSVDRIENIYFVPDNTSIRTNLDKANSKVLLISHPKDLPPDLKPVFEIKDKLGNVIFKAVNLTSLLEYDKNHKYKTNENIKL